MNRRIIVLGIGASAVALFGAAAGLYGYYGRPSATPEPLLPGANDARGLVRPHSPVMGPANARVTIVEFFDPACEACRAMYPAVKQILVSFPNDVRLVLRYTPFHRGSDEAVRILEAARAQGRFEPVLEALLNRQPEWASHSNPSTTRAWEIAAAAGLDVARGRAYASSEAVTRVLEQDVADVRGNMIRGTPTFFINGAPIEDFAPSVLFNRVRDEVRRTTESGRAQ